MKVILLLICALTPKLSLASGTTVGNGGNGVVCKDSQGHIKSVEILDFYEARLNGLTLKLNTNLSSYKKILMDNLSRWQGIAPVRIAQYRQWISEFENETLFVSGASIPAIPDTGSIVLPSGCELEPIAFQRPDSEIYPGVKRYTVSKDLWNSMGEVQRAGLVMHEIIYREGIKANHKTSFPTRFFNGYLATAEPRAETYSAVVIQLPLLWTELGGLMIKVFGKNMYGGTSKSTLTQDGKIDAYIDYFFGDVITDKFSILNAKGKFEGSESYNKIVFDGLNFIISSYEPYLTTDLIRVSANRYNLSFIMTNIGKIARFNIRFDGREDDPSSQKDDPWFQCYGQNDNSGDFSVSLKNPKDNWILTDNNQRISNISSIKYEGSMGMEISTTTNEKWVWNRDKRDYIKK